MGRDQRKRTKWTNGQNGIESDQGTDGKKLRKKWVQYVPNRQSKPEAHTGNLRQDRPMEIGTGSSPQSLMFKEKAIILIVPKRGKPYSRKGQAIRWKDTVGLQPVDVKSNRQFNRKTNRQNGRPISVYLHKFRVDKWKLQGISWALKRKWRGNKKKSKWRKGRERKGKIKGIRKENEGREKVRGAQRDLKEREESWVKVGIGDKQTEQPKKNKCKRSKLKRRVKQRAKWRR